MSWKGKTRGGILGYKIFVFILRHLGLKVSYAVLRVVILYYFLFSFKSTRSSYQFFRNILKYSFLKSLLKVYHNYYLFGQTLIDKIAIMGAMDNRFSINHDGHNHLQQIVGQETGGVFISAHIGNYEMAGHLLKKINTPVNIVMYDAEHEKIKDFLAEVYGNRPVKVITIKDDMSHIFEINNAVKRKEIVCIHGDRFLQGTKIASFDFLGKKAYFPIGPFMLVQKLKIPFTFVFAVKESDTHYHFFASPPKVAEGTAEDILQDYVTNLEAMVRKYPEQWFNFYDFWQQPEISATEKNAGVVLQPGKAA